MNRDFPLGVNLAATGVSPFEKGELGGVNVAQILKFPSIPLFQRGKPVEFSNGKSRFKIEMELHRARPSGGKIAATGSGIQEFPEGDEFGAGEIRVWYRAC